MSSTFLAEKLIAGKSQKLKTFASQLVMHVCQKFIIRRCQSSLACHIDNEYRFLSLVLAEVDSVAFNIFDLEIKERLNALILKGLRATLVYKSLRCCSHQIYNKRYFRICSCIQDREFSKKTKIKLTKSRLRYNQQFYNHFKTTPILGYFISKRAFQSFNT